MLKSVAPKLLDNDSDTVWGTVRQQVHHDIVMSVIENLYCEKAKIDFTLDVINEIIRTEICKE